jgi:hypothetical protein
MEADTTPPDFSKLSQFDSDGIAFGEQLEQESDRGAALVGLAFLDELLKRLFEAKMLDESIAKKLLKYPGALSTAAARADVAYALGWIGAKTYRDLMTLKKIRNGFAHTHGPVKFTDAAVETLCARLELGKPANTGSIATPREQFMWASGRVAMPLEFYRRTARMPLAANDGPPEELELSDTCGVRGRSTQPPDEVEFEAGQWSADFMHCSTRYERSEVNSHNSGTVDQLDH